MEHAVKMCSVRLAALGPGVPYHITDPLLAQRPFARRSQLHISPLPLSLRRPPPAVPLHSDAGCTSEAHHRQPPDLHWQDCSQLTLSRRLSAECGVGVFPAGPAAGPGAVGVQGPVRGGARWRRHRRRDLLEHRHLQAAEGEGAVPGVGSVSTRRDFLPGATCTE